MLQAIVVLDAGDHPLPSYVSRHNHPWDRSKLAAWHSGTLVPQQNAWHSISAVLHSACSTVWTGGMCMVSELNMHIAVMPLACLRNTHLR